MATKQRLRHRIWLALGTLITVVFFVILYSKLPSRQNQILEVGGSPGHAEVALTPASFTTLPETEMSIVATTNKPLAFSHVEVVFDGDLVKLVGSVILKHNVVKKVIKQSSISEANSSGRLILALAVEPDDLDQAPSGTVTLATLKFAPASTSLTNRTATIALDTGKLQLVDSGAVAFTTTAKHSAVSINPTTAVSPSPSAAVSPSPSASTTTTRNPADLVDTGDKTGDVVNIYDYTKFVDDFGKTGADGFVSADIIQDGIVDIYDYTKFVDEFDE